MFYVHDIIDKKTNNKVDNIIFNRLRYDIKHNMHTDFDSYSLVTVCGFNYMDRYLIGVYDSSDNSLEYYSPNALKDITKKIRIVGITNVYENKLIIEMRFKAIDFSFNKTRSELIPDDNYNVLVDKLLGTNKAIISEKGVMRKIVKELIVGDTLYIPNSVISINSNILENDICKEFSSCNNIVVSSNYNLGVYDKELNILGKLANYRKKIKKVPSTLIFNKDLIINSMFIFSTGCNLVTSGRLYFDNYYYFEKEELKKLNYSFVKKTYKKGDDIERNILRYKGSNMVVELNTVRRVITAIDY